MFKALFLIVFTFPGFLAAAQEDQESVEVREFVWTNFKDFLDFGWVEEPNGTTTSYSAPSELATRLIDLNTNFSDEVWGYDAQKAILYYHLYTEAHPEYCGIINATISIKYYYENYTVYDPDYAYIYPACTNSSTYPHKCPLFPSDQAVWSYKTVDLLLTENTNLTISAYYADVFLLDEVRLRFAAKLGPSCPFSCNHDCEYRGIDCHNYYSCVDHRYKEFYECKESDGLAFNPELKSCDLIQNVRSCHKPERCVCEYRPHEYNCSYYYFCNDSCNATSCEERQCPLGLLWSVDAKGDGSGHQQCVIASKAVCHNNETAPTSSVPSAVDLGELRKTQILFSETKLHGLEK